jgi:small nuclear ribonucleoprotein (snRNP)-like protein
MLMDRNDGRALVGQMLAYDKHMNFVLAECEEFRTVKVGPERSEGAMEDRGRLTYRGKRQKRQIQQTQPHPFNRNVPLAWSF